MLYSLCRYKNLNPTSLEGDIGGFNKFNNPHFVFNYLFCFLFLIIQPVFILGFPLCFGMKGIRLSLSTDFSTKFIFDIKSPTIHAKQMGLK